MCDCVCICICMNVYVYIYTCTHACMCVCVYVGSLILYLHLSLSIIDLSTCVEMHVLYACKFLLLCMHANAPISSIYMYICTLLCMCATEGTSQGNPKVLHEEGEPENPHLARSPSFLQ